MSVEPTQLERTALERKDRDELHTIAEAMGGHPAARASKAKIIDLILELAGVTEDGDGSEPEASSSSSDATAGANGADTASPSADAADGDSADDAEPDAAAPAPADRPRRPAAKRADRPAKVAAAKAETAANDEGDDERDDTDGDADGDESGRAPRAKGGQDERGGRGEPRKGGQAHDNGAGAEEGQGGPNQKQHQGNEARGQQGGDDVDAGNRRRRRRGRGDRPGADEPFQGDPIAVEGLLDLRDEGYGFLRLHGYLASKDDVYVSVKQVRQFALRKGDHVKGASRPANRNEKNPALLHIDEVNGVSADRAHERPRFDDLTALFPDDKLRLEAPNDPYNMTARIIDLIAPIGKGTRGLIVSPPKAGKTTVMKAIARSIETNNPEVHLIVLLVDERPEEVTDMRRWVKNGEVAASTFDRPTEEHTQVAELTIERAKRLVEEGKDVVIILDGITRLARAYNLAAPTTGRVMSGGIDTGALYPPKKFFGAARNLEEGGSLTILATALVETGSRMDEVIFEEFKGTGNMELRLDRRMADRRIYPAIDVEGSSTRHEELLFTAKELQQVWKLRRVLGALDGGTGAGLELLIDRMKTFKSNDAFLDEIAKAASAG
jgi:transcription termination factor Rho